MGLDPTVWAHALIAAAHDLGLSPSFEQMRLRMDASRHKSEHDIIISTAEMIGIRAHFVEAPLDSMPAAFVPVITELRDGAVAVVRQINAKKALISLPTPDGMVEREVARVWLDDNAVGPILALSASRKFRDGRIDAYLAPYKRSWFRSLLKHHRTRFVELAGGACFANILALSTAIFAMQIWDRVVPAQSIPTLWVLTMGVACALVFELVLKMTRVSIADGFGKQLDIKVSGMFFARALYLRNDARPKSSGTLIAQLRELDQIRELLTSTTLSVLFEIPFIVIFIAVIAMIGGPLVYIVLAVVPLVLIASIAIQWPLARLSREGMRESALRNAMLVESIERIEDIKSLQSEERFIAQWEQLNTSTGAINLKQRFYSALLMNSTQTLQQLAYVAVLVAGAHLVLNNDMSTGALMACSMLTSRTIAPLAQIASVFTRLQGAQVARRGLDELLKLPVENSPNTVTLHRPVIHGDFVFENITHTYDKESKPALVVPHLKISSGERIALIGRMGSGKSTLLKLIGGLMPPASGGIQLDGTDMNAIDVADIRREIGTLFQDSGLFFGTVRSNLQMGSAGATDEMLNAAIALTGAGPALFDNGRGLDFVVHEGGRGLSSGQRQSLMLARMFARSPAIILLDEPTAAMDENSEKQFIKNLSQWLGRRTFIVATHRYAVLDIVDRIIVLDKGRIVLDGPKAKVIRALSEGGPADAPASSPVAPAQPKSGFHAA